MPIMPRASTGPPLMSDTAVSRSPVPLTCCCTIISSSGEATTDESTPEPTAAPIFSELLSSRGTPPVKAFLMAPLRKNCVMTHPALLSVFAKYPARHRSERRLSANVLSHGACWAAAPVLTSVQHPRIHGERQPLLFRVLPIVGALQQRRVCVGWTAIGEHVA